jgi:hypothetical protein
MFQSVMKVTRCMGRSAIGRQISTFHRQSILSGVNVGLFAFNEGDRKYSDFGLADLGYILQAV